MIFSLFLLSILAVACGNIILESSVLDVGRPGHVNIAAFPSKHTTTLPPLQSLSPVLVPGSTSQRYYPAAYGGDPTGMNDSSGAFAALVSDMVQHAPSVLNESNAYVDLGGAVLDLDGGVYRLTAPVSFAAGLSNFFVNSGSLFADPAFPANRSLVEVGVGCGEERGGSCGAYFGMTDVNLHAANVAWGCLLVSSFQYASVGPAFTCLGFEGAGVWFAGTGGSYLVGAWMGQFEPKSGVIPTATAVQINGTEHDSFVKMLVVWSARVGVVSANGANQLEGIHTWNLDAMENGVGILLQKGRGRVENCYLDYTPLVVWDPEGVVVSSTLFLAAASLQLVATKPNTTIHSLTVTSNLFDTSNATITIDSSNGTFTNITNSVIANNAYVEDTWIRGKQAPKSTQATLTVPAPSPFSPDPTQLTLDFSPFLAIPTIPIITAQCHLDNTPTPTAISTMHSHQNLTIFLAQPSDGTITCSVDQSLKTKPAH